ncbi:MAG: hypothetical protein Ct9H300mP11_32040 [Chloroflexota bacterium]|nr:MAG: hypothetical protein Ct9H300mP11_32040 [Chloroflexota bacterium]
MDQIVFEVNFGNLIPLKNQLNSMRLKDGASGSKFGMTVYIEAIMIWDEVEVGTKIEALDTFEVQMGMGAPTGSGTFNVETGDIWGNHHKTESRKTSVGL